MFCCNSSISTQEHQQWRLKMLNHWRDRMEQRLSGLDASIKTLEEQIKRDSTEESPE
jgi:hypothetical protein|tara:strand:+ start:478 stop:648 length:171 start_codon:yes stop_codon:yes gene_type:complete